MIVTDVEAARSDVDVALLGGKAAGLVRIAPAARAAGANVPRWFCITTEAFEAQRSMPGDALDPALAARIVRAWRQLCGGVTVAVRSSSTDEDLADGSAAGRYESFLDVGSAQELLDAVQRCWASAGAPRARAWRGSGAAPAPMAVLVQVQVEPEFAGVTATRLLTSGAAGFVTSAVPGRSDELVSGHVSSSTWTCDADGRWVSGPRGTLDDRDLVQLVRIARALDADFDAPCEFEWCRSEDGIAVVQARPLVSRERPPRLVFDDTATHEQLGGIVSPLTFSVADRLVSRGASHLVRRFGAIDAPLADAGLLRHVNGRVFLAETGWSDVARRAATRGPGACVLRRALGTDTDGAEVRLLDAAEQRRAAWAVAGAWIWGARSLLLGHLRARRIHRRAERIRSAGQHVSLRIADMLELIDDSAVHFAAADGATGVAEQFGAPASAWMPPRPARHRLLDGLKLEGPRVGDLRTTELVRTHVTTRRPRGLRAWIVTRAVHQREQLGWVRAELFAALRALLDEFADAAVSLGVLERTDDVFLLDVLELRWLIAGRAGAPVDISRRRARVERWRRMHLPHRFATDGEPGHTLHSTVPAPQRDHGCTWTGTPCHAGTVSAEAVQVRADDPTVAVRDRIAVCDRLTPDLMALLRDAAGIVVERGSALSHAVLIARELGIPTVVDVGHGAFAHVEPGTRLRLDGAAGSVELAES